MENLDYIGEYIYDYRKARGISMDELSKRSGVSKSLISQVESGKVNPTIGALQKISIAIDVELADLVDPKNSPTKYLRSYLGETKATFSKDNAFACYQLNSKSRYKSLRIDHFSFNKRGKMESKGHGHNSIEYIIVEQGEFEIEFLNKKFSLKQGEVFEFRADAKHSYIQNTKNYAKGVIILYFL